MDHKDSLVLELHNNLADQVDLSKDPHKTIMVQVDFHKADLKDSHVKLPKTSQALDLHKPELPHKGKDKHQFRAFKTSVVSEDSTLDKPVTLVRDKEVTLSPLLMSSMYQVWNLTDTVKI